MIQCDTIGMWIGANCFSFHSFCSLALHLFSSVRVYTLVLIQKESHHFTHTYSWKQSHRRYEWELCMWTALCLLIRDRHNIWNYLHCYYRVVIPLSAIAFITFRIRKLSIHIFEEKGKCQGTTKKKCGSTKMLKITSEQHMGPFLIMFEISKLKIA